MTRIIYVRHGQTKWNLDLKYQGHSDIELTETGIKQAQLVAERLASEPVASVYASDLGRALSTAQYIADKHDLPVEPIQGLREFHFGEWEGLTHEQITARWPQIIQQFFASPDNVKVPGGETFHAVKERAERVIDELIAKHPDETIAIVSHGGTIRTIICAALGIHLNQVWSIRQDNTAVNIIEYYQERSIVTLLNDIHHLHSSV